MDANWLSEFWRSAMTFLGQSVESAYIDTGWLAGIAATVLVISFLLSLPNPYSLKCRGLLMSFAEQTTDRLVSMIFGFIGNVFIGFLFVVSLIAICGILGGLLVFGVKHLLVVFQ